MGSAMDRIDATTAEWIRRQHVFFVATAPLAATGHVNCSPKGGDAFRIVDERTVAYLDYTGSGAETIAHIRENRRLCIMFCAFEGGPLIVRLYGRGEVLPPTHPQYAMLSVLFPGNPGARAIIRLHVERVGSSCGMAVPFMAFREDRSELDDWAEGKGPAALADYRRRKNVVSIDGLPAIDPT